MTTTAAPVATTSAAVSHPPMWIGGAAVDSDGRVEIRSPATKDLVATVATGRTGHADSAVALATTSVESGVWCDRPPAERADVLDRVAAPLDARTDARIQELAELPSRENNAPVRFARWVHVGLPAQELRDCAGLAHPPVGQACSGVGGHGHRITLQGVLESDSLSPGVHPRADLLHHRWPVPHRRADDGVPRRPDRRRRRGHEAADVNTPVLTVI
ncbi:aldehyde dehydrogenase family protein [Gordonia sp. NPDC003376]